MREIMPVYTCGLTFNLKALGSLGWKAESRCFQYFYQKIILIQKSIFSFWWEHVVGCIQAFMRGIHGIY